MIDFSKVKTITIPEGNVMKITFGSTTLWEKPASYTNQVPISIAPSGLIFNGIGYQDGYRLSSSGATKVLASSTVSGFIPAKGGDVIRINGVEWYDTGSATIYLCGYDSSFTHIGAITPQNGGVYYGTHIASSITGDSNKNATIILANLDNIAFIRVSSNKYGGMSGVNMIVTVNEEIE